MKVEQRGGILSQYDLKIEIESIFFITHTTLAVKLLPYSIFNLNHVKEIFPIDDSRCDSAIS